MTAIDAKSACKQSWARRNPFGLRWQCHCTKQNAIGPISPMGRDIHAVMNAIAHIHIETPRLPKERFVARSTPSETMASGLLLGIRLRFHNHTPQQLATFLALHQQAADELRCDDLSGAGEEGLGERGEDLGGYRSGLWSPFILLPPSEVL